MQSSTSSSSRVAFYDKLFTKVEALVLQRRDVISNCSNTAALIYHELRKKFGDNATNWVGFYFVRPVDTDDDDNAHKRLKSPAAAADDKPDVSVDETKALPTDIQDRVLILGPFHGLPAVVSIPFGKGVCGTAAIQHKTQLVRNVHEVLYHIACDSASQSEIVVPIYGHIGASSHDKDNGNALSSTLSNKRVYDQSNTSRSSPSLVAVLDIDSPIVNGFSEEDQIGLEKIATLVGESCDWLNLCWPVGKQELGGGTCARIHH